MNMKLHNLALVMGLLLNLGCASTPLPEEEREIQFVEQTTMKQKDAFNAIHTFLAKNLGDSNFAIKVKDPEAGRIVTQITINCPELKGFADLNRHAPLFNLEVETKDNKVRFTFEALEDRVYNAVSDALITRNNFSSKGQIDSARICAERTKGEAIRVVASRKDSNW